MPHLPFSMQLKGRYATSTMFSVKRLELDTQTMAFRRKDTPNFDFAPVGSGGEMHAGRHNGGYKYSGIGREWGLEGVEEFLEIKTIGMRVS